MKVDTQRYTKKILHDDVLCIRTVVTHYNLHGRHDLPWRKKITPYRILVSEIMLAQTQVPRVIPKFALWMKRYPTVNALSQSTLQEVLILWQGLGYQRRAKALLSVAEMLEEGSRRIPKSFHELLTLPSVGTYTASAVCAFAYDTFAHPLLETNIRTVLIEYFHQDKETIDDATLYQDLARLEKKVEVTTMGARNWYYALMDYGAHLKQMSISHTTRSVTYRKQTPFKGSPRELRAKVLFAITHQDAIPKDPRTQHTIDTLLKEEYIVKKGRTYIIA